MAIVVSGVGSSVGTILTSGLASSGARVVAIDSNAAATQKLAKTQPDLIEPLRLDVFDANHCDLVARSWEHEPLNALIHLQILEHPQQPNLVIRSIAMLTQAFKAGLAAAKGQVLFMAPPMDEDPKSQNFAKAYSRLMRALMMDFDEEGVAVNGIRLPMQGMPAVGQDALLNRVNSLLDPSAARISGAILPLIPR
ncbi:MAG: hypothetical protein AAGF56_15365 [Pseudomonadota bacterium]